MDNRDTNSTSPCSKAEDSSSAMKIKCIRIKNFRSYEEIRLNPNDFNILVGKNNHGKSNFIEAMEWFYGGKASPGEIKRNQALDNPVEVEVEVTFANVQEGLNEITNKDNREKIRNIIEEHDELKVRRYYSSSCNGKNREIFDPKKREWRRHPCGADTTFNNCIPRFEFVQTTKNLKEVAAYKSTSPIGQLLSGLLQSVLNKENSDEFREFLEKFTALFGEIDPSNPSAVRSALNEIGENVKKHLESQFPDCKNVNFDISPPEPEDLLKGYKTTLDDGVVTSAEEKGDGMQRALMLAIIKAHADFRRKDAVGRSFIFFIDEAELHLHPTAQRQLKESLRELSQSQDQVFITTHSSVFIADTPKEQTIFAVQKENSITTISKIEKKAELQDTIFELLGGHPADLLLPPNFLIVEGQSEYTFISGIIGRFYCDKPNIKIIAATGDDKAAANLFDAIQKMLSISNGKAVYGDKIIILLDTPKASKETRYDAFKKDNSALVKSKRIFELPTKALEDYYPTDLAGQCQRKGKVQKAKWMAENISQEQFESEMGQIFLALSRCWELAFANKGENDVSST